MTASPDRPGLCPDPRPAFRLAAACLVVAGCATGSPAASATEETRPAPSQTIAPSPTPRPSPSSVAEVDGLLVFNAETPDGRQLFTMRPDGRDPQQITHVEGDAVAPEWAPDGTRIAFQVNANDECNIAFVDHDGANLAVLPRAKGACEAEPTFTPDGERLMFGAADPASGNGAIWSMNTDGTDRVEVGVGFGLAFAPKVSPDGTTVSASGWNLIEAEGHYEGFFTMKIDGTEPRWVSPNWANFPEHDWSPDGESIVVSDRLAHELGPANIALLDGAHGSSVSHPTLLTSFTREDQRALTPSFSPDGEWIIFRLREHDLFALYRMRSDGSDLERVTAPSAFDPAEIDWGPAAGS
jgi:Tol biopolymer transport system component